MFEPGLKRLFLILFPLALVGLAFFLIDLKQGQYSVQDKQGSHTNNCDFLLGVSFFPHNKKNFHLKENPYFLSKKKLIKQFEKVKGFNQEHIFFVLPLALTKEEEWIVSRDTFFILPSGERKEISHLTFSQMQEYYKDFRLLKIGQAISYLPKKANFLFYLLDLDQNKVIKNMEKIMPLVQGDLYFSSLDETLLKKLLALSFSRSFKILHSFKALTRVNLLPFMSSQKLKGHGVIIPFPLPFSILNANYFTKKGKVLVFFEKDPPYTKGDMSKTQNLQALISSQPQLAISSMKHKKTCFIKK